MENNIQHITIFNNQDKSFGTNIDVIRPLDAKRCFISLTKFEGFKLVDDTAFFDNLFIYVDNIRNSYSNNETHNNVYQNKLLELITTSTIVVKGLNSYANFNYQSKIEKWHEIDLNSLVNLQISFKC
jgi:hypothetical protein